MQMFTFSYTQHTSSQSPGFPLAEATFFLGVVVFGGDDVQAQRWRLNNKIIYQRVQEKVMYKSIKWDGTQGTLSPGLCAHVVTHDSAHRFYILWTYNMCVK